MSEQFDFEYRALPREGKAIRLLNLLPKGGNAADGGRIECTLRNTSLDDPEEFCALSYTWGSPLSKKEISLNGHPFQVTENLYVALTNLQHDEDTFSLWIDAICINQEDSEEKTHQVQLMRDIYKRADVVLIWLGPSTPETDVSMKWIQDVGDGLLRAGLWEVSAEHLANWDSIPEDDSRISKIKKDVMQFFERFSQWLQEGKNPFWWLASDVGKSPWFWRVWCQQECANAKMAIFRCGEAMVEFSRFWATAIFVSIGSGWMARNCRKGKDDADARVLDILLQVSGSIPGKTIGIRRKVLTAPGDPSLHMKQLLCRANVFDSRSRRVEATDPRDRVYALLGLANDGVAKDIVADYTISCADAYIATAKALLKHRHLDTLALCRKRALNEDLPSWVPDWTGPNRQPWFEYSEEAHFNASDSASPVIILSDEDMPRTELKIGGTWVDNLAEVGQEWSAGIDEDFKYDAAGTLLDEIAEYVNRSQLYGVGQKEEAVWKIPIGDLAQSGLVHWPQRATLLAREGYLIMHNAVQNNQLRETYQGEFHAAFISYMGRMQRMHDSRPFITDSGYVGLCPKEAQPGDAIVVVLGAPVPFLVRKVSASKWVLVGETYVFGIMDGEFMSGQPTVQVITLQ